MTDALTHSLLEAPRSGVRHGFLTRRGGVSQGLYSSLNCGFGSDDASDAVATNRARAAEACGLAADAVCTAYQVHSAEAQVVDAPWQPNAAPRIDAMATATPGVALGILTADCVPVLLADHDAGVIGACHAGWRGALDGVLEAGLAAMQTLGARTGSTHAVLGPCIGKASYEVGPEFPEPFLARAPEDADLFTPSARPGHHMFDIAGYVVRRLTRLGIGAVAALNNDTCAESDVFFSYRRSCHHDEPDYGRQISLIGLVG